MMKKAFPVAPAAPLGWAGRGHSQNLSIFIRGKGFTRHHCYTLSVVHEATRAYTLVDARSY